MGLGKTIEALALILARPSRDREHKTTLIVAPVALLEQWKREIKTKVKHKHALTVLKFHGPSCNMLRVEDILQHDIVLCTYGKLITEYKMAFEQKKKYRLSILHKKAIFHRVILDEAHNIKNMTAKASLAAAEIRATYRLCMTGTPFMNRAGELYPLIRFLRILPYSNWDKFSEDIDRPIRRWDGDLKANAMQRLRNLFRSITIRRTKDSVLDNKPILRLPPRREVVAETVFDADQLAFYKALERQQRLRFNKYLKAGTVMQNYIHCLVLLLRLRQVCDHPHLIKNHGIPEGAKLSANEMLALASQLEDDVVERIMTQTDFKCPMCPDAGVMENPVIVSPCGHCICSECYSTSMAVRQTEGDGNDLARIACPADGCEVEILPDNIIMYNFFVDAHMPDSDDSDDESIRDEQLPLDGYGDEWWEETEEAPVRDARTHPNEYTNNMRENANDDFDLSGLVRYINDERDILPRYSSVDMSGFVVEAEDSQEEEDHRSRSVNEFNMPSSEDTAALSPYNQPEWDNEDDSDSGSSKSQRYLREGSCGGLFVSQIGIAQNPERSPTPAARDPIAEDENGILTGFAGQVDTDRNLKADVEIGDEMPRDVQPDDGQMASQAESQPVAIRPLSEHSPSEHPDPQRLSSPNIKIERSISPCVLSPNIPITSNTRLVGKGTANDPFTIDDEEEEPLQTRYSADKHRDLADSNMHKRDTDAMDIVTYDGPSSPRLENPWRKRKASIGESIDVSHKKPRAYDSLRGLGGPKHRANISTGHSSNYFGHNARHATTAAAVEENAQNHLNRLPDNKDELSYENLYQDNYDRQKPYRHNRPDHNTPVPSIEADSSTADARRKQRKKEKKEKKEEENKRKKEKERKKKHAKDFISLGALRNQALHNTASMHRYSQRLRKEWVPSAKTDKIMSLLRDIQQRDPRAKTLVFSLWTSFLDLLEVPLLDEVDKNNNANARSGLLLGSHYTRYDGGMRPEHRDAAVRRFMDDPGCRVMLVSLTAGNAGLNLTAASNVIVCEPFWNPFTEDQAVDRAHRIGQKRAVTVYRVLVAGTVEDRILALQAKKRALVQAALGDDEGEERGAGAAGGSRLTVQQLSGLFGS